MTVDASTPRERLWQRLESWFSDSDDTSHAGPEITFDGLTAAQVDSVWQLLRERAEPLDSTESVWDKQDEMEVGVVDALDAGAHGAERFYGEIVNLRRIRTHDIVLPWLGLFLYPDAVGLYWWVSDEEGWDPDLVAGFAELLGDIHAIAPEAGIEVEWDEDREVWPAIEEYLSR